MNTAPLAVDSSYIVSCVCVKEADGRVKTVITTEEPVKYVTLTDDQGNNWGECHNFCEPFAFNIELDGQSVDFDLEFIDFEHTPKNILIRAVKTGKKAANAEIIKQCEEFLHVSPTLGRLLKNKGEL